MAGAIVVKQIKPQRLRDDRMRLALLSQMHKAAAGMLKDFQSTTKTWEHKVKFEKAESLKLTDGPSVHIITTDEIYNYVNNGTKPHLIFAGAFGHFGGAKALKFQAGYTPKTSIRVIGSKPGGPHGPVVHAAYVNHPGSKGRHFDEEIQEKWEPKFKRLMEEGMSKARADSGHAIA